MNDLREQMTAAADGPPPPPKLTESELHAAGRRRLLRRRVGAIGGGGAALAAVAALALALGTLSAGPTAVDRSLDESAPPPAEQSEQGSQNAPTLTPADVDLPAYSQEVREVYAANSDVAVYVAERGGEPFDLIDVTGTVPEDDEEDAGYWLHGGAATDESAVPGGEFLNLNVYLGGEWSREPTPSAETGDSDGPFVYNDSPIYFCGDDELTGYECQSREADGQEIVTVEAERSEDGGAVVYRFAQAVVFNEECAVTLAAHSETGPDGAAPVELSFDAEDLAAIAQAMSCPQAK